MARKHKFDTGWAWSVNLGSFIVVFILISWVRVAGLIFIEIQNQTGESTTNVAWVQAAHSIGFHFLAPFSAILDQRYGTRRVVMVGGWIVSLSMCSGFYMRQLPYFILMGALIGIGSTLCFTPCLIVLTHHFRYRLGVANGITAAGSSVSQVVLSPVVAVLLEEYGLPGCLLIFGALTLNLQVSAALYFPVDAEELAKADKEYELSLRKEENVKNSDEELENENKKSFIKDAAQNDHLNHQNEQTPQNEASHSEDIVSFIASLTSLKALQAKSSWILLKEVLSKGSLWILLISYGVGTLVAMSTVKYGPPHALQYGLTIEDCSFFLAMSGIPGIVLRVLTGIVADLEIVREKVRRYRIYVLGIVLAGGNCFLMLVLTDYAGFLINFLLMGVSSGLFFSTQTMAAFDLLGQEHFGLGYGLMHVAAGLVSLLDTFMIAHLRDVTGTFDVSFIVCGVLAIVVSVVMLVAIPLIHRRQRKSYYAKDIVVETNEDS